VDGELVVALLGAPDTELAGALSRAAASFGRDLRFADTSALTAAAQHELRSGDRSHYAAPLQALRGCRLTLLAASAAPATPIEALLRAALLRDGLPHAVVSEAASALQALRHTLSAPSPDDEAAANPRWQWVCERCGDVDCERHLLPR